MKKFLMFLLCLITVLMAALLRVTDVHAAEYSGNFDDYKYPKPQDYYINYTSGNWNYEIKFSTDCIIAFYMDETTYAPKINYIFSYLGTSNSTYWNYLENSISCEAHEFNSSGTSDRTYTSGLRTQYVVDSMDTNVPIFDTQAEAQAWILEGGQPPSEESHIYFKDFKSSGKDILTCTWSDVYYNPLKIGIPDLNASYYEVVIESYTPGVGTDASVFQDYQGQYKLFTNDKRYVLPVSEILVDDSFTIFNLKLTPYIVTSTGSYVGSTVVVQFNSSGYLNTVVKDEDREEIYDDECNFLGVSFSSNSNNHTNLDEYDDKDIKTPIVNINWRSISHTYDVRQYYNPEIRFALEDGNYVAAPSSDYNSSFKSSGVGYFEFRTLDIIHGLTGSIWSSKNNPIWYITIIPKYTDGYANYYGNPYTIKMHGLTALYGGIANYVDPKTPLTEDPPSDWVDPDPWGTDNPDVPGFDLTEFDIVKLFTAFYDLMVSLIKSVGQIPSLVGHVFSFLPSVYTNMLLVGLGLVIILRILGR